MITAINNIYVQTIHIWYDARMIVVIIAGGSGTRLWPLSTTGFPKHLLALTNEKSLLQNTFERVQGLASVDRLFVITEVSHAEHVKQQLPHILSSNIIIEPGRRGTASCVALGLAEIKARGLPNEPIFFLWADHIIRDVDSFVATILRAGQVAEHQDRVVFIGAEPNYASTKLGYIKKGSMLEGWHGVYDFAGFVEKPDKKTAESYLNGGMYLWNMGYLVAKLSVYESNMEQYSPLMDSRYKKLLNSRSEASYLSLEAVAIEYIFSEKLQEALVIQGTFDWADVGSFGDLHDMSVQDENGNHKRGSMIELESTTNSFVRNETGIPVAVIGLDNVVVVSSPNGVLVTNKNFDQRVGAVAKRLQG